MTLKEMESSPEPFLSPEDVAPILECKPYTINLQAQRDPLMLGFPVSVAGTRVRIPREAFLFFLKYGHPVVTGDMDFKRPPDDVDSK